MQLGGGLLYKGACLHVNGPAWERALMSQKRRQGSLTPLGLDHVKDVVKPRPGHTCV